MQDLIAEPRISANEQRSPSADASGFALALALDSLRMEACASLEVSHPGHGSIMATGLRPKAVGSSLVCEWPFDLNHPNRGSLPVEVTWLLSQGTTGATLHLPGRATLLEDPEMIAAYERATGMWVQGDLVKTDFDSAPFYRWPDGRELHAAASGCGTGLRLKVEGGQVRSQDWFG